MPPILPTLLDEELTPILAPFRNPGEASVIVASQAPGSRLIER